MVNHDVVLGGGVGWVFLYGGEGKQLVGGVLGQLGRRLRTVEHAQIERRRKSPVETAARTRTLVLNATCLA